VTASTAPDLESLPADVRSALLRGIGAYLRSGARAELPSELRRFAGFRQRTLQRHGVELLSALERPEPRARILEWLQDSHGLRARECNLLREACERRDGWSERLTAAARASKHARAARGPEEELRSALAALSKERERARRARDDARRARAEARRGAQRETARQQALARELELARVELGLLRRELRTAESARSRAALEAERELRRLRRDRDRSQASAESLRAELRQAKKEITALERARSELGRKLERSDTSPAPRTPRPRPRGRRRPLRAPPGRMPDDVDTLDEWLEEDHVSLLVDGYNVTKAPGGFGALALAAQRERLTDSVERLARRRSVAATIVFDGSDVPRGTVRRHRGAVDVHYSRPPESADDHLVAVLEALPADPVVVVTSDRGLQERVRGLGATVASAQQLLGLIR
jgi:predicted RNA-binding protein with PIN domain